MMQLVDEYKQLLVKLLHFYGNADDVLQFLSKNAELWLKMKAKKVDKLDFSGKL